MSQASAAVNRVWEDIPPFCVQFVCYLQSAEEMMKYQEAGQSCIITQPTYEKLGGAKLHSSFESLIFKAFSIKLNAS